MKGLNCYAAFCDSPGHERLLTFTQTKNSLLVPGCHYLAYISPFSPLHLVGFSCPVLTPRPTAKPAIIFPKALHFLQCGQARLEVLSGQVPLRADRFKETS